MVVAVLVDCHKGFPDRGLDVKCPPHQGARARLLGLVPDDGHFLRRLFGLLFFGGGVRFQHDRLARAGHIHRDPLAAQFPGQLIRCRHIFFLGVCREVDRLGEAVVDESLHRALHAHVLVCGNITGDHKGVGNLFGQIFDSLARAVGNHLRDDGFALLFRQAAVDQGLLKKRAGVRQLEIFALIVHVADIRQSKHRFTAVALTTRDGGNRAGGGNRGLGRVADAVLPDALGDSVPIQLGSVEIFIVGDQ